MSRRVIDEVRRIARRRPKRRSSIRESRRRRRSRGRRLRESAEELEAAQRRAYAAARKSGVPHRHAEIAAAAVMDAYRTRGAQRAQALKQAADYAPDVDALLDATGLFESRRRRRSRGRRLHENKLAHAKLKQARSDNEFREIRGSADMAFNMLYGSDLTYPLKRALKDLETRIQKARQELAKGGNSWGAAGPLEELDPVQVTSAALMQLHDVIPVLRTLEDDVNEMIDDIVERGEYVQDVLGRRRRR